MTGLLNNKAKTQIKNMILTTYTKIDVLPGACRYNYKCHMNAVHEATVAGDDQIAMVYYIDGGHPIIHFLNYHKGKYTCNTLGHWIVQKDFFLVKFIIKDEFLNVDNIFGLLKKQTRKQLSFWVRLLSNQEF